jgi:hypothetical protein
VWECWQIAAGKDLVMTEERAAQYFLLLELASDIISPEHYGHAVPPELVRRVARILKQLPADAQRQPGAILQRE